jgi:hypothetical protein
MARSRRERVWLRARGYCEYCQLPQEFTVLPHELDHIRAQKHHGQTSLQNLCLACAACNVHKGSDVAGYDPETRALAPLFNPRRDRWDRHFSWDGPWLFGKTPSARATIDVLRINDAARVEHRRSLIALGVFPPA